VATYLGDDDFTNLLTCEHRYSGTSLFFGNFHDRFSCSFDEIVVLLFLHGTRTSGDLFTAGLKAEVAFCIDRSFSSADASSFMSNTHSAIISIEIFPKTLQE
jgi:hypothetical protein